MEENNLIINNSMSTFDTIRDIFYSGTHSFRGESDSISEIAFLVEENYLLFSIVTIASKSEHSTLLHDQDKLKRSYEAAGGSNAHVALKILTRDYIKNNHDFESVFEHPFCGYYPDVINDNETIVAECGHTGNPEKMLVYFRQGNIKKCIQIPYPSYEDKEIKGYCFTAKEGLKEFLIFLEKEKRAELKTIFFNRGNKDF